VARMRRAAQARSPAQLTPRRGGGRARLSLLRPRHVLHRDGKPACPATPSPCPRLVVDF
jgi:hypothetical protein